MNTTKELMKAVSGLSEPSKMPCHGYSISAFSCKMGSKLRDVKGSVCSTCYARKGFYTRFPKIQACLNKRKEIMLNDANWINNMVELINRLNEGYFRWFDSGDIQSVKNLTDIFEVCKLTPNTKHWLPTKEHGMVVEYINAGGVIPSNVTLRLSAYMTDKSVPVGFAKKLGVYTNAVSSTGNHNCLAPSQNNECKDCRKCWDKNIFEIVYKKH